MRPMVDDSHVLELLPAYALGSLDVDEARLVAEHVAGCAICRGELQAFQQVADELPLSLSPVDPPASLRPRLLERVRAQKPAPAPRRGWFERLLPLAGAAALVLLVGLALSTFLLWQRLNTLEVLSGPRGMRAIALQSAAAAPRASAFVVMGADGRNGVLVVDQLPQLDPAHEYQLWLDKDGRTDSAGTFAVDETGYRGMRIVAPDSLLTYESVRITIEPAGGSPQPQGQQVLSGSLFNR